MTEENETANEILIGYANLLLYEDEESSESIREAVGIWYHRRKLRDYEKSKKFLIKELNHD